VNPVPKNPKAHLWNLDPAQAIERARKEFGDKILIEAGASLMTKMLNENLIDEFFLTLTPVVGGENIVDWQIFFDHFTFIEESKLDETIFYHAFR
jgi:riboflavin biosynthesis pyrimidine reductase